MKRKHVLGSLLVAACITQSAQAGHLVVISATPLTIAATNEQEENPFHMTRSNNTLGFEYSWGHGHIGPVLFSSQESASANVQVKVKWVPDYPTEPKPGSAAAYWDISDWTNVSVSGWVDPESGAYAHTEAYFSPSVNSAAEVFESILPPMNYMYPFGGTQTTSNYVYGGFTFAANGSDWVGTGNFAVNLFCQDYGRLDTIGDHVSFGYIMARTMTLKKVGSWNVL
jgi:hypothetical protein